MSFVTPARLWWCLSLAAQWKGLLTGDQHNSKSCVHHRRGTAGGWLSAAAPPHLRRRRRQQRRECGFYWRVHVGVAQVVPRHAGLRGRRVLRRQDARGRHTQAVRQQIRGRRVGVVQPQLELRTHAQLCAPVLSVQAARQVLLQSVHTSLLPVPVKAVRDPVCCSNWSGTSSGSAGQHLVQAEGLNRGEVYRRASRSGILDRLAGPAVHAGQRRRRWRSCRSCCSR